MLAGTHRLIANNIFDKFSPDKKIILNKTGYLWGNIKPDYISKYKLKKHYYTESIDMIMEIIERLSALTIDDIINDIGTAKFSAALGVVTHFLCDYYCLAHSERWEFKVAMKKHVGYERALAKAAKEHDFSNVVFVRNEKLKLDEIRDFILETQDKYKNDVSFINDLNFAYYVSNTIVNLVVKNVLENSEVKEEVV